MTAVVKNRPAMLMILGYGSHMWEMYGMRSWPAPFFTATLVQYGFAGGGKQPVGGRRPQR